MKINVLVVNDNRAEGDDWRKKLSERRYIVLPECLDMSDMFYTLTQEKVHVVICAGSLFKEKNIKLLESSQIYFPGIKIVLVGFIAKDYLFSNLGNVALTKRFPTELEKYYSQPVDFYITEKMPEKSVLLELLGHHFLSDEEATAILARNVKLNPAYAVIFVRTDHTNENVLCVMGNCAREHKSIYLLPYRWNEFIFIAYNSPAPEYCVQVAADIRTKLLAETDTKFSIGISRMRVKAAELYACRKEAERASMATHMFGQNSVININYLDSNDIEYMYPLHKEKRLIEATMDGDTDSALQMLEEIFSVLKSRDGLKQSLINKFVLGILVSLNIAASSRVSAFEKMNLDSLSIKNLMASKTIGEAHDFMKQGIYDFASEMDEITDVKRDALFHKLSMSKEIPGSVDELAQKLNTTMTFINTAIYKNNQGDIFDYIDREEEK